MAKPKGSKTRGKPGKRTAEAKEDTVEMRTAGELDLPAPVVLQSDDFHLHLKAMKSAVERQAQAKNLYDGCCKAAKKVSADLLEAVKLAISVGKKSRKDIHKHLSIYGFVLKETESSIELTLHDTLLGDVMEVAARRGMEDSAANRMSDNPYPGNSDLAKAYDDSYAADQRRILGIGPDDEDEGDDKKPAPDDEPSEFEDVDDDAHDGDKPVPIAAAKREPVLTH